MIEGVNVAKHELVEDERLALAKRDFGGIFVTQHGAHAGEFFGASRVYMFDLRVRVRAAQDLPVEHPHELNVKRVECFAGDALRAVVAIGPPCCVLV